MDDQRFRHRATVGVVLLAAVFVWLGFLPVSEWLASAMRLIA